MMVLPSSSVTTMLPSPSPRMTVCTFREDGHGGLIVRHHHCAAFTARQHHITLGVPGRDDVAIRAKHRA